ncbi:MAG: Kelch repeat-containing protein [Ilumatobacteraceae bacterium]
MTTSLRRLAAGLLLAVPALALIAVGDVSSEATPPNGVEAELPWPDRRFAPCGALDEQAGVVHVFGGRADDGSTHLADAWSLDLGHRRGARPAWTPAAPAGATSAPPAVRSCAAAWDPTGDRLLVFGGWDGGTHDGGLRAFDPASGTWEQLCDVTACGPGPAPRRAAQLVVDDARRRVLVFGGTNGSYFDDVWSLSLEDPVWTRLDAAGPRPISRAGHSTVVDAERDAVFLFGGTRPGSDLADLWRFDLATDTWTPLDASCPAGCPAARSGATLSSDLAGDRLALYGGWESATNTYHREAWTLEALDSAPVWRRSVVDGEAPQARYFHVAGWDDDVGQLVVFGGGSSGNAYKDAFGLRLPDDGTPARWNTLSLTTGLTARDQVTVVLDDGVLTAFGGFGAGTFPDTVDAGTHLADTWQRQLGRRSSWRLSTPTDEAQVPIAREGTAFALDAGSDRLVMFGGLTGDTTLADVWTADLGRPGRPVWRQLCSPLSCGQGPSARWGAHAVHDPVDDRLIVFGGMMSGGVTANDVWALDVGDVPQWHQLSPAGAPPPARWSAAHGYDPVRHRMVIFGGQTGSDATGTPLQDTWALTLGDAPAWTRLATSGPQPAPRRSPASAVRVTNGGAELIVATGLTVGAATHHDDVWSLALGDDSAQWVELVADGPSAGPAPRRSATAVYDPRHDRLVMTFGRSGQRFFDDTWAFDLEDRSWYQLPT